jgi:hypothetical protein
VTTDWTDDHGTRTVRLGDDPGLWHADDRYGVRQEHVRLLQERAIAPEVAKARGYRSAPWKEYALKYGDFSQSSIGAKWGGGLLIPVRPVEGGVAWWQYRPDRPRAGRNGKKIKYLTPKGAAMRLDVHPSMRHHLGNPSVPLFITEGIMKGDALNSLGLCTVSLLGVYNWRGTGPDGGITALGDWESVHLKDRRTYIVYDSDVMQKSQVQNALRRLHEFLRARGADLRVIYLPYGPGATKTGVDDFIATGKTVDDLLTLATDELREMPQEQDQEGTVDAPQPRVPVPPMTLAQVEQVHAKWLGDHDLVPLRTVLAAVTANLIMGSNEPVWIMVVGGSGFGKTETIAPLSALPLVHMASSISSEGALLSATPKRDKTKGATGACSRRSAVAVSSC